ncbi:MAG: type II toxin-antitoxin system HicB family antitoxin [Dolichospermum sp. DET69]|jgi:predicted RNase H-like HicB family nuclease|nr:MAG: type II toxin-antitoxin system HicB family antitoxin [Dolichospermum sp. DET69]
MDKYLIVLEKTATGFSAYSPDVWGCIATGETLEKTLKNMRSALVYHLQDSESVPQPRGIDAYLDALRESEGEEFYLTHIDVIPLSILTQEAAKNRL